MIHAVDRENEADFFRVLASNPLFGASIRANYEVYGTDERYLSLWLVYNERAVPHMVVQYYHETMTLCCAPEDNDSQFFAAFLSLAPQWRSIVGPQRMVASLPSRITGRGGMRTGCIMELDQEPTAVPMPQGAQLCDQPELRLLFSLLGECSDDYRVRADYGQWYADLSHRVRHGGAVVEVLKRGGLYVSTASAFVAGGIAVIRDVCTLKSQRRCGCAAAVTSALCGRLRQAGLRPALLSVSPGADALYRQLGFEVKSVWAALYNRSC